jgi:hypothetical protein
VRSDSELSSGKVYVLSQSKSVDLPKIPAFGYCDAWMWVSVVTLDSSSHTGLLFNGDLGCIGYVPMNPGK